MAAEEQARFISLTPPTSRDAGGRYLAFLQEELSERGKADSLLAVYASKQGSKITLWTFFAGDELREGGPEREAAYDAEVKIKAGYFTPFRNKPRFSIEARTLPTRGRSLQELEAAYLLSEHDRVRIFPQA